MEAKQVDHKVNRSDWPCGPWDGEPDHMQFVTEEGYSGVIIRSTHQGHLCGYVGIPASHPWHGKDYSASVHPLKEQAERPVDLNKISVISLFAMACDEAGDEVRIDCLIHVHGGITYSAAGIERFGEDPALWFFGFDCSHSGDVAPGSHYSYGGAYRSIEYVKAEIAALSKQLATVAKAGAA